MNTIIHIFAAVGFAVTLFFCTGFWLDFRDFDRTKGGYEAPFEGVTGEPVDWFALDRTPTGVAKRGYVVNILVDATSGLISFEFFGLEIPFRPLSGRALAVHKPREAFVAMGFSPSF